MTEASIRPPTLEEKSLFYQVYETGVPNVDALTYDGFSRWWNRSKVLGDLLALWRVATVGDEIVGVAINMILDSFGWGAIWELVVTPEWRRKGIGTLIVQESERALLERNPNLTHFAMGVKLHNPFAIPFTEHLGYGIQSLVLRLDGAVESKTFSTNLEVKIPRLDDIPLIMHLTPDTYWGLRDYRKIEFSLRGGNCYLMTEPASNMIVGFARFEYDHDYPDATVISFSYRQGYGKAVVDAALNEVTTKKAILWVEVKHEIILDHLYAEGFERTETEFLARKRVKGTV
ncbi:MAG: GNAT family N-acetyltransferase [Candidatus Thorarchaeota archaeon]